MLLHLSIAHPRIEDGLLAVHPKLNAVLGLDDEFVRARLGREKGAAPTRGEFIGLKSLALRCSGAPIKIHRALHAIKGLLLVVVAACLVPCAGESTLITEGARATEKFPHQIRNALFILPPREPAEHHPRRLVSRLRRRRIESLVNVLRHPRRIFTDTQVRLPIRHRLLNLRREFGE